MLVKIFIKVTLFVLLAAPHFSMAMEEHPYIYSVIMDRLEFSDAESNPLAWDVKAWLGRDLEKYWLKAKGEVSDGDLESLQIEALYSRALAPFWDLQFGLRHDARPTPEKNWAVIALHGLAPYFFEVDAALYVGESGNTAAHLSVEYELLLNQRLILSPEIEATLYTKDNPELQLGSGLSELGFGLRLRYVIRREFAPYIGVNWSKNFGQTANFAEALGEDSSNTKFTIGLRAWF